MIFKRLPPFARNFYVLFGVFFLSWMLFFDSNDLISQVRLVQKRKALEQEKEYYVQSMKVVKEDREALLNNEMLLEKFARERYLMKKPTEDLYVVVEE